MKIEDYALIGDQHTAALVGRDGSIDWLCLPRFDGPACFASLLGHPGNGHWKIAPPSANTVQRHYRGDSLVLETVFTTSSGSVRVIDCMPVDQMHRTLLRRVEGLSGEVMMHLELVVRFDYGLTIPWVRHLQREGICALAGPQAVTVRSSVPLHGEGLTTVADFVVRPGQSETFALMGHGSLEPPPLAPDAEAAILATERYWSGWAARCTYRGPWEGPVRRSLLTLKALTSAATGGIVAAATTSLPEFLGGVRNWDYRYCWLRDATFTLYSFMSAGFVEEAKAWSDWLLRAAAGDPAQLQIMYGLAGERSLVELELPHLAGYEGSKPVRVGNEAAKQFQLDVYGEVMDAMHYARSVGIKSDSVSWRLQRHLVHFVAGHWREPDEGIWEVRGPRRHFTHSKVMAWVAMDRAVKAVTLFGLEGEPELWSRIRDKIHADVCERGFNTRRGVFTQHYDTEDLDASLLMLPLVGFLPASDPRVLATIEAIAHELTVNGLVRRYRTQVDGELDGLPAGEGTFLPCSFWLVDCLHLLGRHNEAQAFFERLLALRSDLGLYAEEYEPRLGRQLGNYPQAFTHVGMINSALNLSPRTVSPAEARSQA